MGPRDLAKQSCVTCRRDRQGQAGKEFGIPIDDSNALLTHVRSLLERIHSDLLLEALVFRDDNIVNVDTYEELKKCISEGKWARGPWAGSDEDEERVKNECQATLRCFPFDQPLDVGPCLMTGEPANEVAIFGKAY